MKLNIPMRRYGWPVCAAALSLVLLHVGYSAPPPDPQHGGGAGHANYDPCNDNIKAHLPIITCQPLDQVNNNGNGVTFSVRATSSGDNKSSGDNLTYQWYHKPVPDLGGPILDFQAIPDATNEDFSIAAVTNADYGVYFCVVAGTDVDGFPLLTQTRFAELGGATQVGGAGGNFGAMQFSVASSTTTTICGQQVSGYWVKFPGTETPNANTISFQGSLKNVAAGTNFFNSEYILQWWVNVALTYCCTNVTGSPTDVQAPINATKVYKFIAHFKQNHVPPAGTVVELDGTWQP